MHCERATLCLKSREKKGVAYISGLNEHEGSEDSDTKWTSWGAYVLHDNLLLWVWNKQRLLIVRKVTKTFTIMLSSFFEVGV